MAGRYDGVGAPAAAADADADQARVGRQDIAEACTSWVKGTNNATCASSTVGFVAFAALQLLHDQVDRADAASAV